MFTGLIEDIGTLRRRSQGATDVTLLIETQIPTAELALGDSVAVNGVCLTVTAIGASTFSADASHETLAASSLGRLKVGDRVHLERALAVGGRLGGHMVQGHVDGTARLARRTAAGRAWDLWFDVPTAQRVELVPKGSITIDGVSLTVNEVNERGCRVTIIPHTEDKTLLGALPIGATVNVETDIIGKYVRRFLGLSAGAGVGQLLKDYGYAAEED